MRRTALIVAALVMMVTACGGDDSGDGETPAKAEWIASADAICADMFEELDRIPEPQTPAESYELAGRTIEIQREALAELRALTPPRGDETAVEEILDAHEALIDWGEEMLEALEAGDQEETFELHADAERLADEADRLAGSYGLRECLGSQE